MGRQLNIPEKGNETGTKLNGSLAIGCFASICRNHLGDELLAFARECPDVELGVHEMTRACLLPALQKGDLALAILPETEAHAGLPSLELWQDQVMVALHRDHPLTREPSVAPNRLTDDIILVSREQHGGDMHRFLAQRILPCEAPLNSVLFDLSQKRLMEEVAVGKGVSLVCGSHSELISPPVTLRPIAAAGAAFSVRAYWVGDQPEGALAALLGFLQNGRSRPG